MIDKINGIEESLKELEKDIQDLGNEEDLEASEVLKRELTELRNRIIKERIREIEQASSKTYKQNDSNDYIQLNSAHDRPKLIHESDEEEYKKLVNIWRQIVQENNEKHGRESKREYNESAANLRRGTIPIESALEKNTTVEVQPEQPIEEQISNLHKQIMDIANNAINEPNHGKATTVNFEGKKYKIPKKREGEFKTLLTQYNGLRKKHNVQNIPKKEQEKTEQSTVEKLIGDITTTILNEQQNQKNQESDKQIDQVIGMVNNAQINKQNKRENEQEIYDWQKEEEENEIVAIKGNKNKDKIKNLIKQNKQKIKKAIVGVMSAIMLFATVKGILKLNNKPTIPPQEPTSSLSNNTTSEQNSEEETIIIEEEYKDAEKENRKQVENVQEEDKENKESESSKKSEEKMQTGVVQEGVQEGIYIGATVNLKENTKIYKSAQDSILENNAYNPYYGYDINRVIIGVSIEYENKIINIFPNIDNANKTISDMLNNGGKVVSILTANKQNLPDNFDGNKKMTNAEINQCAEGFINGYDIDLNREERGIKK